MLYEVAMCSLYFNAKFWYGLSLWKLCYCISTFEIKCFFVVVSELYTIVWQP